MHKPRKQTKINIIRLFIYLTIWPFIIVSIYKRNHTTSKVLKSHYKWKLLFFGKIQMRDGKDETASFSNPKLNDSESNGSSNLDNYNPF